MKQTTTHLFMALCLLLAFAGCSQDEGEGGTASISGRVLNVIHDDDIYNFTTDTVPAAKTDVFIAYGNGSKYVGDDVECSSEGYYRFAYLTPGTYTIYAYSEKNNGERIAERTTIELKRGEEKTINDIYIHTGKAYNTAIVRGQVRCTWVDKNYNALSTSYAYGERVYIRRINDNYYFDDTRVGNDGYYYFQKLTPDTYIIFTYSQNSNEVPYPVYDTVSVSEQQIGTIIDASTISVKLKA